jgi:hypothetical protein
MAAAQERNENKRHAQMFGKGKNEENHEPNDENGSNSSILRRTIDDLNATPMSKTIIPDGWNLKGFRLYCVIDVSFV